MITKKKTKQKILKYAIMTVTLSLMIGCVFCNDIFVVGEEISKDLYTRIKEVYCDGLFWVLGVLDLVLWAVYSKDDKKRAIFKGAMITLVGVYLALNLYGVGKDTIDKIIGKYSSDTETSIEYTGDIGTDAVE